MGKKIYVATSWRNAEQPEIVAALRDHGHEVYDFRHPMPENDGFSWAHVDAGWAQWSIAEYLEGIKYPIARLGFGLDKQALDWCDTCVLVLPCGRSAHLEAGYAAGQGKRVIILLRQDGFEPELMYLLGAGFALTLDSLLEQVS
jgi:hypothetical protein